jgi:hypothetical protein
MRNSQGISFPIEFKTDDGVDYHSSKDSKYFSIYVLEVKNPGFVQHLD